MDNSDSGNGGFLSKFTRIFTGKSADPVEQAILEASQEGELQAEEGSMMLSILHLDDIRVEDIMTPRTDMRGVDAASSVASAIEQTLASGHSRLPVYQDNRDNIVGVIHAKDLLREAVRQENMHRPVADIMRQPFFVPESKNARELLNEFRARKTHMAIILDEYGGTSGLVTIEDVLEEIVGDIEDEHDAPKKADITLLENGGARISGRAYLEDVNQALGVSLASDEVDTIGGLLSHIAGRLPLPGERFILDGRLFIVEEADNRQVRAVLAPAPDAETRAPEAPGPV